MADLDRTVGGLRCRDLLSLLPDFVDRDLSPAQLGRVGAHLESCGHCAKFGGEYGALVAELKRSAQVLGLDPDLHARLHRRLETMWEGAGGDHR